MVAWRCGAMSVVANIACFKPPSVAEGHLSFFALASGAPVAGTGWSRFPDSMPVSKDDYLPVPLRSL